MFGRVAFVNDGPQCKWGAGSKGTHMPSGVEDTSFLPSSLALCPKTLKRTPLFFMVLPLLGIFPKETMKSAVQRFLCKDVHHTVIYKGENLEAVWTYSDGEWGVGSASLPAGIGARPWEHLWRGLRHKGTSRSRLNEEAGRMVAGAGSRAGAERKGRGQSEDGDMLGEQAGLHFFGEFWLIG